MMPPFLPILLSENALDREYERLQKLYKHFELLKRDSPSPYHYAKGFLEPLHSSISVSDINTALILGDTLYADEHGHLIPTMAYPTNRVRISRELFEPQLVEIIYTSDGPVPYLMSPRVDERSQPFLVHQYRRQHPSYSVDPTYYPDCAACIIAAEDKTYNFAEEGVSGLLPYIVRHIAAFRLWRYGDIGRWPLEEAYHFPLDNLLKIPISAPCHCQRSLPYGKCCYTLDRKEFMKGLKNGKKITRRQINGSIHYK